RETFTYTVTDNHGKSSTAVATVDVTVNDPGPPATSFSVETGEDTALGAGALSGHVTAGEAGDPGDSLTYSGPTTSPDGALVTVNANGSFSYDPTGVGAFETLHFDATATDTFTYTVTDNHGKSSTAVATVDVTVNDPGPTATSFSVATGEDTAIAAGALSGHVTAGEAGDTGDSLTYSGPTTSTDGALVTVNANGSFSYHPTGVGGFETLHFHAPAAG